MNRPVLQRLSITFNAEGVVLAVTYEHAVDELPNPGTKIRSTTAKCSVMAPAAREGGGVSYRCPACNRRVRSAPYVSLQDGHNPKITRYHGPGEIVLGFYHTVGCGDPTGRMSCWGVSHPPNELTAEGAA